MTTLTPGKSHLLRLVNVGINNWIHAGLDGHEFLVVAADFVPIEPYKASSIVIAVGKFSLVVVPLSTPLAYAHDHTLLLCYSP